MNKAKIAIIDTGLNSELFSNNEIIGGCKLEIYNKSIYLSDDWEDEQGHGTFVAATIKKYCVYSTFYIIKIYDGNSITSSVLLLQALELLLNVDVDFINISLAVNGNEYQDEISSVIKELSKQGKMIFASVKNGNVNSFPACDVNCYGVYGQEGVNEYKIVDKNQKMITGDDSEELVEISIGVKKMFKGNSKATAKTLGIIASKIISNEISKGNILG